jgi:spore coat protein U-like protein
MRQRTGIQPALLACGAALAIAGVHAAHAASCTVSTSGLNFGNYDVFSTLNDDITATINVNCPSSTTYSIWLSTGTSGTYSSRSMTNGPNILTYNLFTDPTRLTIWGDGSAGTGIFNGTGTGSNIGTPVYGRIPAGQNAYVGIYNDVVTVTVTF